MALQLDKENLCCSVCLDLLKDPVTIPCGHSFCISCVKSRWDKEDPKEIYSCPHCQQTFTPRPVLVISSLLADLVKALKKTRLHVAPADCATPGDVACDFCAGRKLKAHKSCLTCRVSYCELHLQPHYESPAFEKHKLVGPSKYLQEKYCPHHDEVMKIFCRTDQQTICVLCSLDEHRDHDTVSAAVERNEKRRELGVSRHQIQHRIQDREKDVNRLKQEMETISRSADEAVRASEKIFNELVGLVEKRNSAVTEGIRSQQKTEVGRAKELKEKLEEEIAELRKKDAELEQLPHTEDHVQFLHNYLLLSNPSASTDSPRLNIHPLLYFEDVIAAVSEARDELQEILNREWLKISLKVSEVDVLLPQPEPKTRDEFLQYYRQITLDVNTVNAGLSLSEENRKATVMREKQSYCSHADRFTDWLQVLSSESLTGRCYWEVERSGGGISVAVAYKDISRTGSESGFGNNEKSWAFGCFDIGYNFRHNNITTSLSGPQTSRVGVYLDH
ncbi:E3 ubiquitin/ISG15 ligase TRIM25 [Etheostoma spectabile]|uniref:E3 ubiquitin/ISG15 ligase TRIM25 n=1 Tax=Etheostoma spectabile TaxID=54343 RepID=UPI0013AF8D23|nr:E3 ubiquitin/ISG15 ligase TRIM25-like [Etheostoma spectabile]